MAPKLIRMLKEALGQLEIEKANLDRQIQGIQAVLGISDGSKFSRMPTGAMKPRTMSAAARKRVSQRMRKYWAERRKAEAKSKKTHTAGEKNV